MTTKTPATPRAASTASTTPFARRADNSRQITRESMDEHMAAFRASGGVVEVLGNTPLQTPARTAARGVAKPTP